MKVEKFKESFQLVLEELSFAGEQELVRFFTVYNLMDFKRNSIEIDTLKKVLGEKFEEMNSAQKLSLFSVLSFNSKFHDVCLKLYESVEKDLQYIFSTINENPLSLSSCLEYLIGFMNLKDRVNQTMNLQVIADRLKS